MSAWSEMERVALLGTRRETMQLPLLPPALAGLLSGLPSEDAEDALLSAAGTIDLYEQIGRVPSRLRPEASLNLPLETRPPCPPQAAHYLAALMDGSLRSLMPEFLQALHQAGMRIPAKLLPNFLEYGYKRAQLRPFILPVLGRRGRWLAGQHERWNYAAVDPAVWSTVRKAWDQAPPTQRASLVAQLRAEDPELGRALVGSVWRAENDQLRLLLIKQLETGLAMADEPLLETALDDRSRLVRRHAAGLLASLPESRLCQRTVAYVPRYLAWTPSQTRQITVSLPTVTPAMRRDGIIGARSKNAARVRSQEIIQLVSAVPLDYWTTAWEADPHVILRAIPTTSWPRTLSSGYALAAARQKNARWARAIVDELGLTRVTAALIPVLNSATMRALVVRAQHESRTSEITRDSTLTTLIRAWPATWETAVATRLLNEFVAHFRVTAQELRPQNLIRDLFFKVARQADTDLFDLAAEQLGEPDSLGCWRNTALEFLHILRFRRSMLEALQQIPARALP